MDSIESVFYLLKINNGNNKAMCAMCSNLTVKTPDRRCSAVCIVNYKQFSYIHMFPLLTLNSEMLPG